LLDELVMKTEKPSRTEVSGLLRRAEDYASSSLGGVLVALKEDPARPSQLYRNYARLMHGLEVHYLFPNLRRSDRKVLSDLLDARNKLVVRQRLGVGRGRTMAGAGQAKLTRRFRVLKTRAKALGRSPVLTPAQREVLGQLLLPNL
jgi:hypothetical protein